VAVTPPDIGGATLVFVGSFNPAILHPEWFAAQGLLTPEEAEQVEERAAREEGVLTVTADVTVFQTDWFILQATSDRLLLGTSERTSESFFPLRDLALGVLTILRHTPVEQMGMNHTRHIGLSEGRWDAFSHSIAPPTSWTALLDATPELASIQIRTERVGYEAPGFVAITVEPSVRIPSGVFVSVNDHVELPRDPSSGATVAAQVLRDHWETSHESANHLFQRVKERA
jgi:hypothetical protein